MVFSPNLNAQVLLGKGHKMDPHKRKLEFSKIFTYCALLLGFLGYVCFEMVT